MPELPEVEAVRRTLDRAMRGARIVRVQLRRPDLRRPFPPRFAARLTGQTVTAVDRRGKYLLARLESFIILESILFLFFKSNPLPLNFLFFYFTCSPSNYI